MINTVNLNLNSLKFRNYVRKADPKIDYWFSFYVGKMNNKIMEFGNDFFIIIHGSPNVENDYFIIPYMTVRHVFTDRNTTKVDIQAKDANTRTPRWSGNIINRHLHVTHSDEKLDLTEYYGNQILLEQAMGRSGDKADNLIQIDDKIPDPATYDPENVADGREKIMRTITQRRGQATFRDRLLEVYQKKCSITGCTIVDVLEAAHITPYLGPETNHITNGLLLRSDLHTLLDCRLLAIDPETNTVMLAPSVREAADYRDLHGRRLRETVPITAGPSRKALQQARLACSWLSDISV
jgi:hypothetical protein